MSAEKDERDETHNHLFWKHLTRVPHMAKYLREWNKRTILVRPTKLDGVEEVQPWDCLDITDARLDYQKYTLPPFDVNDYIKDGEFTPPPQVSEKDYMNNPVVREIEENYEQYRSIPFSTKHANNDRMDNPFFGCCVVAAEALYFLTPESHSGASLEKFFE